MTDYLNPHKLYPDDISRRIDIPPGFDSVRDGADSHAGDETANLLTHLLENGSAMTADESKVMNDSIERLYKKTGSKIMPAVKESLTTALDENGLVPCGCGGKARIEESPFADDVDNVGLKIYMVGCAECTIGFEGYFTSIEDAQEHWNTAMGWREKE